MTFLKVTESHTAHQQFNSLAYDYAPAAFAPLNAKGLGAAILGINDSTCEKLATACSQQALAATLFSSPLALLNYDGPLAFTLVIVQAKAVSSSLGRLLEALRSKGFRRVALIGPEMGDSNFISALHIGFDDVWPEDLPQEALSLVIERAWHASLTQPLRTPQREIALGPLKLRPESASCEVNGVKVFPGRVCFALLQCLAVHYPGIASRQKLEAAIGQGAARGQAKSRAIDMSVFRLRKKLENAGIRSVRVGTINEVGYQLLLESWDFAQTSETSFGQ